MQGTVVSARTRVVYEDIPLSSLVGANLEVDVQGLDPFEQSARLEDRRKSSFLGSSTDLGMRVRSSISVSRARSRLAGLGTSLSRSSSGPKAPSKTPDAIKQESIDKVVGFNKDLVYAEELPTSVPADALWRVRSHGKASGSKYDNVVRISVVDALDDPEVGAVIVQVHSLDADDPTPIPEREEGHELLSLDVCMAFKPVWDEECNYTGRCQVDRFVTLNLPATLARTISWMPSWVLRGALTSALAKEVQDVGDFARFSKVLDKMMANSTRASLYSSLSRRSGEDDKVRASLIPNLGGSFGSDRSGSFDWSAAV